MLAFVAGLPLTGQCYTNWELAKEPADDKPTYRYRSAQPGQLPGCRPYTRNCVGSLLRLAQPAGLLVLEVCGELDLAGADTLDRLAKPCKRNGACTEKRVDCGSAYVVEEVKELRDQIQVTVFAKLNSLDHTKVHICRSLRL